MRGHATMQVRCPAATGSIQSCGGWLSLGRPNPRAFNHSLLQVVVQDYQERQQRAERDNRVRIHKPHPLSGMPPDERSTAPRIVTRPDSCDMTPRSLRCRARSCGGEGYLTNSIQDTFE